MARNHRVKNAALTLRQSNDRMVQLLRLRGYTGVITLTQNPRDLTEIEIKMRVEMSAADVTALNTEIGR